MESAHQNCSNNTIDLSVEIAGITMKNPIMPASGTFGFGREYSQFFQLDRLGAIVTKGLTLLPKAGNPPPRIHETPAGMLNSVGLQNPGVEKFMQEEMPYLARLSVPIIVNIDGDTVEQYCEIAGRLSQLKNISGIEVNISCPNVERGGIAFGQDPESAYQVVKAVREMTGLPIIAKLSPNVTSITDIAKAVVSAGADAVSLINTVLGMAIDIDAKRPVFNRKFAGLSGPAVKPLALRMVWQVYEAVDVPIIGMGGITCTEDAIQFFMAGATAVAIGTANFIHPYTMVDIIDGLYSFLNNQCEVEENFKNKDCISIKDIIGIAHENKS
jgi:dihydroorotate dehydrogenase (NAD+) catalytic subunit